MECASKFTHTDTNLMAGLGLALSNPNEAIEEGETRGVGRGVVGGSIFLATGFRLFTTLSRRRRLPLEVRSGIQCVFLHKFSRSSA